MRRIIYKYSIGLVKRHYLEVLLVFALAVAAQAQTPGISASLERFDFNTQQACVRFTYTPSADEQKRLVSGSQIVWYYGDAKDAEKNPEPDEYKSPAGMNALHCYENVFEKQFTVLLLVNDPKHIYINQFKSLVKFHAPMEMEKKY